MKLGILAQYLETRPDITELINRLATSFEVVVFRGTQEKSSLVLDPRIEIRTFSKQSNTWIKGWHVLFKAFGKVPRSKHNYFITEDFKIQNSSYFGSNVKTWWNQFLLFLNYRLPGFISYDRYISQVRGAIRAELEDIDTFLCYTQIYDDGFLGNLIHTKKKVFILVYSWDHPCKMKCFSKKDVQFLVWNENIKRDLVELQGLENNKIQIVGTSQFGYLNTFLRTPEPARNQQSPYLYFAFSTGTPSLARQEVAVIRKLATILKEEWPEASLMLRPYPFLKSKGFYDELKSFPNLHFEPEYAGGPDIQEKMNHKYRWMNGSAGFFHFGTTLGVEACFLRCPVFFLSLKGESLETGLHYFIHQYQNDAYLHKSGLPNTIETYLELKEVFRLVAAQDPSLKTYNQEVCDGFSCTSFEDYSSLIEKKLIGKVV